jgi:tellurite resistance-related uncharacterized protein
MKLPSPTAIMSGLGAQGGAAWADFRRMMIWIALAGIVMVALALFYLSLFSPLRIHMIIATVLGVFFSVLLGSGLFAAAFFSANSGYDDAVDKATRASREPEANPAALPPGLAAYRRTPMFDETSVPAALLKDHNTKAGSWGLIHVEAGRLRYRITDPRREPFETELSPESAPGLIEPTILHHVEPLGPVRFQVEFWRAPADAEAGDAPPVSGVAAHPVDPGVRSR